MESLPHLPRQPQNESDWFDALVALARYLRTPEGCPWDREQSASDFARFLAEETAELREALDMDDAAHAKEELGDVFFTVLAAAAAAEEQGMFRLEDVLHDIHAKMIRRHDHVFGENKASTPEEAVRAWNAIKAQEKGRD